MFYKIQYGRRVNNRMPKRGKLNNCNSSAKKKEPLWFKLMFEKKEKKERTQTRALAKERIGGNGFKRHREGKTGYQCNWRLSKERTWRWLAWVTGGRKCHLKEIENTGWTTGFSEEHRKVNFYPDTFENKRVIQMNQYLLNIRRYEVYFWTVLVSNNHPFSCSCICSKNYAILLRKKKKFLNNITNINQPQLSILL